jgi:hyperosmotically inducible periplasmic protein
MKKSQVLIFVLFSTLCWFGIAAAQSKRDLDPVRARLAQQVRHELIMLSNYSVFDNLEYQISDVDTVTLSGQVTRPTLKNDAETAVRRLEGVGKLINKIEVLPISPSDERLRIATYRAIYSKPGLDRYAMRAVPPVHIIIKNGSITLVGFVANQGDKDIAGIAAREVPGAFGVTNNLKIDTPQRRSE